MSFEDVPHGTLTQEFYKSKISDNWEKADPISSAMCTVCRASGSVFAARIWRESEISWSTTGKSEYLMDNLIAAGKKSSPLRSLWKWHGKTAN